MNERQMYIHGKRIKRTNFDRLSYRTSTVSVT